jgi:hypothetical protein
MKYFDAVLNCAVKNQVIFEALHPKLPKLTQPLLRKFSSLPQTGHLRQFLKSAVSPFDETVGSIHIVDGDVFPNCVKFRLDVFGKDEIRHSGGVF